MRSEVLTLGASAGCRLTGLLLMLLGQLRAVTTLSFRQPTGCLNRAEEHTAQLVRQAMSGSSQLLQGCGMTYARLT